MIKKFYSSIYPIVGKALRIVLPNDFVDRLARSLPMPIPHSKAVTYNPVEYSIEKVDSLELVKFSRGYKKDIFIFAIIGWSFRTQRPQHIARELAEQGNRVFYIEMDMDPETSMEKLGENLYRIRFGYNEVGHIQPYTGVADKSLKEAWLVSFFKLINKCESSSLKDVIIQHPYWWQFVSLLSPEFNIVFDCMDDIGGFDNTTKFLLDQEHEMVNQCDRLIVSSAYLQDKLKIYKNPYLIRNAGQVEHFHRSEDSYLIPDFINNIKSRSESIKIHIGYVGAIAQWFDWELIKDVALARPDVFFHLAGAVTEDAVLELDKLDNVHLYGEIDYQDVPGFMKAVDIGTIPFRIIPIIEACDPVKFYEYCGVGLPTIITPMPELQRASELTYIASDAEQYIKKIDIAFKDKSDIEFVKKLKAFAVNNTWKSRGEAFSKALEEKKPKVSIIVLSYGDPNLTTACLDSLFKGKGNYPNMEVIVVDNGSEDRELGVIKEYIATKNLKESVCMIENGKNLGFAAGNNVGLNEASGQYVLLLNNDTYVGPGAINALVQQLQNNPRIGVIGPLTNNIGNEAKVDIDYDDMENMEYLSRFVTAGYRGQNTQVNVAAYFAVMFRKKDLDSIGFLPLEYGLGMFEDDDHCNQFKSEGFKVAIAEDAFIHHHLSANFDKMGNDKVKLFNRNKEIYEERWGKWVPHSYRCSRPTSKLGE